MTDQILVGAAIGCLYALVAQGFALTYRTTHTLNFAVGEFAAIGVFVAMGLATFGRLPGAVRIGIAAGLVGLLGALVFRVLIRPFVSRDGHDARWLLVTVALSILIVDLLRNSQGTVHRPLGFAEVGGQVSLGVGQLPARLAVLAMVSLVLVVGVGLLVTRTGLGMRMRAVAEDASTAGLVGIDARRTGMISYAIGSATTVIGATLWTAHVGVFPDLGALLLIAAFSAAIIGGLASVWGVLAGGVLFGVLSQLFALWFGATVSGVVVLLAVVGLLVIRPQGLFATRMEVKV